MQVSAGKQNRLAQMRHRPKRARQHCLSNISDARRQHPRARSLATFWDLPVGSSCSPHVHALTPHPAFVAQRNGAQARRRAAHGVVRQRSDETEGSRLTRPHSHGVRRPSDTGDGNASGVRSVHHQRPRQGALGQRPRRSKLRPQRGHGDARCRVLLLPYSRLQPRWPPTPRPTRATPR